MNSSNAVQIPDAAKTLLGQFKAIHQVQTLEPVVGGISSAVDDAIRRYPVVQRFVLTGAGELGQFTKEAATTAGKVVNNLKVGACVANKMGGRPDTEEGIFFGSVDCENQNWCHHKLRSWNLGSFPAFSPVKAPQPTKFPGNIPECQNQADHLISKRNSRIP